MSKKDEYLNLPFITLVGVVVVSIPFFVIEIQNKRTARIEAKQARYDAREQELEEGERERDSIASTCPDILCLKASPGYIGARANGRLLDDDVAGRYGIVGPKRMFSTRHYGDDNCIVCGMIVSSIRKKREQAYNRP